MTLKSGIGRIINFKLIKMMVAGVVIALPTVASAQLSQDQFGTLKGEIELYDGAGCHHHKKEDEKKEEPEYFAADDYDYAGLVVNFDGKDVFLKEKFSSEDKRVLAKDDLVLTIKYGPSKDCGEECWKSSSTFEYKRGKDEISIPTYTICES